MSFLNESKRDLEMLKEKYDLSFFMSIFSNRGWQSLFVYRLSNILWKIKIPLFPMILTRMIQVLYGIDIDFKCEIEGGIVIIHGVGIVIGKGVKIEKGSIIYHQVTLGEKGTIINDGYPKIGENVILGCGCKLLGPIRIGKNAIIGANIVLSKDVESNTLVRFNFKDYELKKLNNKKAQ